MKKNALMVLAAVFLFGMASGYIAGLWQQAAQHKHKIERMNNERHLR